MLEGLGASLIGDAPLADGEARKLIRTALDRSMVVEAAAGTGKTTEMVHRMVAVLREGRARVEEIVAVTFTEKAAGELRLRLREGIERARRAAENDLYRDNLERALAHLEEARISTIHGFCADLLRERPVEARVDPAFSVMTEGEVERRFGEAFGRWLEETLAAPPPGVRRLLRRRPEPGPGLLERLRRAGQDLAAFRDFPARYTRPTWDRVERIDALVRELSAFVEASASPLHPNDPLYQDTEPVRALLARLREAEQARGRDHDELEAELCALERARGFTRPRRGSGARYGQHATRADLLAAHEALVSSLERFVRDADADLCAELQGDLGALVAHYEARKAEAGVLDFEDLLVRTRDLVRDVPEVRTAFGQRYRCIFVDEFQDTDPLQAEILMLLAAADPSVKSYRDVVPGPGKLFLVGDPKQAIYRFRRADIAIYEEVKQVLVSRGALFVRLGTSFRSVPSIQRLVNASFAPAMKSDGRALQARYAPLRPARKDLPGQPSIVALPAPEPYGKQRLTNAAIDRSVPAAVGAFLAWLFQESGWKVVERDDPEGTVPVAPRHVCLLFRRFETHGEDVTRAYVEALEARGIPHVLVGGKSFYAREEVETMLAALRAIEWPDDELSVFATLHGSLLAVGDEPLLEWRHRFGKLHPQRIPSGELPPHLLPIAEGLALLARLHDARNTRPVADTLAALLEATRAHIGFALRPSGERSLANVLHLSELGRAYEAAGGASFRGFVLQLEEDAARGKAPEAPILEEGGDGVRIMTAHRAKGLEFPVVVLCDITARLGAQVASRFVDASRGLAALRLCGFSPWDLLENETLETGRDEAEGVRLAYVAATRARDLLVIPAVGDAPLFPETSWVNPIHRAIAPERGARPSTATHLGCPSFGDDTVRARPSGEGPQSATVRPGLHAFSGYEVVWWDAQQLDLDREPAFGVRREDLLRKDAPAARVEEDLAAYHRWAQQREADRARGAQPSLRVVTVTDRAQEETEEAIDVPIFDVGREAGRPAGPRFGELVHGVLAAVDLGAGRASIEAAAAMLARTLGATQLEQDAAARAVEATLAHPLLLRARAAEARGECRRETPLSLLDEAGTLIEGIVDLAFREDGAWMVVDFKTDREIEKGASVYRRQVALYAKAIGRATGERVHAALLRV
jgi:ATP-dependent exoDNAse (exonuclease V) beta subunit